MTVPWLNLNVTWYFLGWDLGCGLFFMFTNLDLRESSAGVVSLDEGM